MNIALISKAMCSECRTRDYLKLLSTIIDQRAIVEAGGGNRVDRGSYYTKMPGQAYCLILEDDEEDGFGPRPSTGSVSVCVFMIPIPNRKRLEG